MAIRKGSDVRYIGDNELAKGKVFRVHKKDRHEVLVGFPMKYLDGSVHLCEMYKPIKDFEEIR